MPKLTTCDAEYCAGREYEGLRFLNPLVNGEFVHNLDYSSSPPSGNGVAFFADQGSIFPGTKRKRIQID